MLRQLGDVVEVPVGGIVGVYRNHLVVLLAVVHHLSWFHRVWQGQEGTLARKGGWLEGRLVAGKRRVVLLAVVC